MELCIDCKHCIGKAASARCYAVPPEISPVDGSETHQVCTFERSKWGRCKPEALLFSRKPATTGEIVIVDAEKRRKLFQGFADAFNEIFPGRKQ